MKKLSIFYTKDNNLHLPFFEIDVFPRNSKEETPIKHFGADLQRTVKHRLASAWQLASMASAGIGRNGRYLSLSIVHEITETASGVQTFVFYRDVILHQSNRISTENFFFYCFGR